MSKQGRTPIWFIWLSSILQQLPEIPSEIHAYHTRAPSTDRRRKEWVSFSNSSTTPEIGKITSKSTRANRVTLTHWTSPNNDFSYTICKGCELSSWKSEMDDCIIQKLRSLLKMIPDRLLSHNKPAGILRTTPMHQHLISPRDLPTNTPTIAVDNLDNQLIKSALADNSARRLLIIKYLDICNNSFTADYHQSIDIYTDGSLNASKVTTDDAFIMGSGWYIPTLDISYGCASTGWPSSTKAELVAIWIAVLAVPSNFSHINIYSDSQAAIDGITNGRKSTWSIRQYSKTPNAAIIEQIIKTTATKGQDLQLIKVKGHSGNICNDIADDIAKNAVITAHQDPSYILELSHTSMQSRLQFKLFWKDISWDGCLRKNLSVLSALPYCADWAHSKPISPWFDNEKNNTVPLDLLRIINNVINVDRIYFSPGCYIRWDITWLFMKSLRRLNRHGPSFNNFYSFALKCINGLLPTGTNLSKRISSIYDNWSCPFCNTASETLQHFLMCPNLEQSWSDITLSIYTHLQQILIKLKTRHALPSNQADFLPIITDFATVEFLPPCRYLAIGVFPAYIIADLHDMGIRQNIKKIGVSLLKHAMAAFRSIIWIPKCTLNAEREKRLGITARDKKTYAINNNYNTPGPSQSAPGQHQLPLDRWKRNWKMGLAEWDKFVKKGCQGFNHGWGLKKDNIVVSSIVNLL